MASSLITSLNSLLHFLDLKADPYFDSSFWNVETFCSNNLKAFVLCARKFGNDSHLTSLFLRIQYVVARYPEEQDEFWQSMRTGGHLCRQMLWFKSCIDEWYTTMSDPNTSQKSSSPTPDDLMEITDSILHNIDLFFQLFKSQDLFDLALAMESLRVRLTFLMNFLLFSIKTCVECRYLDDLLTHFDAVAINAAHILFRAPLTCSDLRNCHQEMQLKLSDLFQNIKPDNLQIYQIYAQALTSSNLYQQLQAPTQDMDDVSIIVLMNFLDSLILLIWDFVRRDTCQLSFMKDPTQQLYEGLRSLGAILGQQQQQGILDEKLMDQIRVLVSDAGVLFFSLQQRNARINPGLQDFLERIKVIQSTRVEKGEDRVPQTSIVHTHGTSSEPATLDSLLEILMELTSNIGEAVPKNLVLTISEKLVFLRSFLEQTQGFRNEPDHELQELRHHALDVMYRVEFLMDQLVVGDISDSLSVLSDFLIKEIGNIKNGALLKISHGTRDEVKAKEVIQTSSDQPPASNPSKTDEFVGFHDEATSIVDRLTRGSKQLQVVAICGMGGAGKTTLASQVFNHPSIMFHFYARAWCVVSQVLDKQKLLIQLLNQIDPQHDPQSYSTMSEHDLEQKLWRCLKRKKYLIFLDDVWNLEDWKSLERAFPNDSFGSRIIVTSRYGNVVPEAMLDEQPHYLRLLTKEESLELMQRKLFPTRRGWPPQLFELGMEIAENCKGLPLMIVIVAGILATKNQEDWKEISSDIGSSKEPLMNTFELSFKHLPNRLKPCFLYFGAFPEDEEVSVKRLIRLWIAEGFVRKINQKSIENVAQEYMADLIERSLVMLAKTRSTGGAKTCRIHDLIHGFCSRKVKEEEFFHFFRGHDQLSNFAEPTHLRRLCIYDEGYHFKKSKLFWPRVRTLLWRYNGYYGDYSLVTLFIIPIFKLLEVLDLEQIDFGSKLPSGIGFLVHLKYLSIRGSISDIPSSIGNLSNLETFILVSSKTVSFPHTFWSLQKLRCMSIKFGNFGHGLGFLPFELDFEDSSVLYELASFSGAIICPPARMEKQMKKFPNIRKLKCYLFDIRAYEEDFDKIVIPDFLTQLESLHLESRHLWQSFRTESITFDFDLPPNLKKLTLTHLNLPWKRISIIEKLPNLEVLKLNRAFSGDKWEIEEGEFLKLRFLKLSDLNIINWIADSDDPFPYLQKLVLDRCIHLLEMPSCLEYISTLEMVDVYNCSTHVQSFVEGIEREQQSLGNSSIKISIHHITRWRGG